jgi:TAP-like protein
VKRSITIEPGGTTHAGALFGNACVDNKIANFLATGKKPARKARLELARVLAFRP